VPERGSASRGGGITGAACRKAKKMKPQTNRIPYAQHAQDIVVKNPQIGKGGKTQRMQEISNQSIEGKRGRREKQQAGNKAAEVRGVRIRG
jgi:hypothetical protein